MRILNTEVRWCFKSLYFYFYTFILFYFYIKFVIKKNSFLIFLVLKTFAFLFFSIFPLPSFFQTYQCFLAHLTLHPDFCHSSSLLNPSNTVCAAHTLCCVTSHEGHQPTRGHIFKLNYFSLFQKLSSAKSSWIGYGTSCQPLWATLDFVCLKSV